MIKDYLTLPLPVRILCLGSLINRAGSFVLIFLAIYASEQLGFGVPFATACIGVLGLGSMLGSLLGGYLTDRVGRRSVMLLALYGGAAALMCLSMATQKWSFMALVACFALISDLYRPAASAMIADLVPIDRRPHAFALMYIAINLGFAIAPPIGGLLSGISFQALFWFDALTMVFYGTIILFAIEETSALKTTSVPVEESGDGSPCLSGTSAAYKIATDLPFVFLCASSLLMALVFVQAMSTLPIYFRQIGFSNVQFGLLMSINGVLIFVLQLPITHWLSRFNAMTVVMVGGVLISVGFGLTGMNAGVMFIGCTIAIWTLGEILQAPFMHSIVTEMAPEPLRGTYLGAFSMCYSLALMIGAPIGGTVLDVYGPMMLFGGSFAVAMTAVLLYLMIHRTVSKRVATVVST